jgi:hypothetical protein
MNEPSQKHFCIIFFIEIDTNMLSEIAPKKRSRVFGGIGNLIKKIEKKKKKFDSKHFHFIFFLFSFIFIHEKQKKVIFIIFFEKR